MRDQFLHVETEIETQCTQYQFLRLKLLKLVLDFETEIETSYIGFKN